MSDDRSLVMQVNRVREGDVIHVGDDETGKRVADIDGETIELEACPHDNTTEIGEQERTTVGGDIVRVGCLDCGETWKRELPE